MANDCVAVWLGRVPYADALALQMQICEQKKRGFDRDVLLLLEHPPTITLGRSGKIDHLLASEEYLKAQGIELWQSDRGGDITFHGPGQLVGYPILALQAEERDVRSYMRNLEESLMHLLAAYGIATQREPQYTGVWTQSGKIAAMGVHISRWITRHGFALNVNTDMAFYKLIIPCGIVGKAVTSMQQMLSRTLAMEEIAGEYMEIFGDAFQRRMMRGSEAEVREALGIVASSGTL